MRVVVISDTHKNFAALKKIVEKHRKEAVMFLILGDSEEELDTLLGIYPDLPFRYVRGNCDMASFSLIEDVVDVAGVKIFMTHGHHYDVKVSMEKLISAAKENDCIVALYGHTHVKVTKYEDGIHIMNPGSPAEPRDGQASYGIIDIQNGQVLTFTVNF